MTTSTKRGGALALTGVAALALVAACSGSDDRSAEPGGAGSGGASSSTPVEPLDYSDQNDGNGVLLESPADVADLVGAPSDFTEFIVEALADADRECQEVLGGEETSGVVTVQHVRPDGPDAAGVAVGSVGGCGGAAALWAVVDGDWRQVEGTQEAWDCRVLERYDVPGDFVGGTCYDYRDREERSYP